MSSRNDAQNPPHDRGYAGGPQPYRGTNYAVNYAIQEALDLLGWPAYKPTIEAALTLEPRLFDDDGVTKWDLTVYTPLKIVEVKLSPQRSDVIEFLNRVRMASAGAEDREFLLVYGSRTPLIDTLRDINRIAREATNATDFNDRLEALHDPNATEVVQTLERPPLSLLRRVVDWHEDEAGIRERAIKSAGILAGSPTLGERVFNSLTRRFHEGGAQRKTFDVDEIARIIASEGIDLFRVPFRDLGAEGAPTVILLLALQACRSGIPIDVAKPLLGDGGLVFADTLQELRRANLVFVDGPMLRLAPRPYRWRHAEAARVLSDCLVLLLNFIEQSRGFECLNDAVRSAADLAKECQNSDHRLVWDVFPRLNGVVKQLGNKDLTIELARVSLQAARRHPRDKASLRPEGLCLICGISWVHQRRGLLGMARDEADAAYQIAKDTKDAELSAFCLKCTGRILRMEAEVASSPDVRDSCLTESEQKLIEAIHAFPNVQVPGFFQHRRECEIGDCHSLLARTLLEQRDYRRANQHAAQAAQLLGPGTPKEFCDLLIVRGDIAFRENDIDLAMSWYDDAVARVPRGGATESEIEARAYFHRGRARGRQRYINGARSDLKRAAEIWRSLDDLVDSDRAAWECESLDPSDSDKEVLHIIEAEPVSVRIRAIREYRKLVATSLAGRGAKRRKELDWESLGRQAVDQARVQALLEIIRKE